MTNFNVNDVTVVDVNEVGRLLYDNGYRLVRVNDGCVDPFTCIEDIRFRDNRGEAVMAKNFMAMEDAPNAMVRRELQENFGDAMVRRELQENLGNAIVRRELQENLGDEMMRRELREDVEKEMRRREELARLEAGVRNPKLTAALRKWRGEKAKELNVPVYIVLNNKTLLHIAGQEPATIEELLEINGFGPKTAEKYASEILAIVADECEEQTLPVAQDRSPEGLGEDGWRQEVLDLSPVAQDRRLEGLGENGWQQEALDLSPVAQDRRTEKLGENGWQQEALDLSPVAQDRRPGGEGVLM